VTKTERLQVEALDNLCSHYGLPRGEFKRGGKHGRYTVVLPNQKTIFVTVACTPLTVEGAIERNESNFKHNIAKAMGWSE